MAIAVIARAANAGQETSAAVAAQDVAERASDQPLQAADDAERHLEEGLRARDIAEIRTLADDAGRINEAGRCGQCAFSGTIAIIDGWGVP